MTEKTNTRVAALDLGGTRLKACLFCGGVAGERLEVDTLAALGAADVLRRAGELLEQLGPFDAVGISTAGQVEPETGIIRYANENLPGYTGTDVRGFFTRRFGVPTAVLNDVYAAALGEGLGGAARGARDYLCLTYGTGVGGGVVLDGVPYYGRGPCANPMLGGLITHPEAMTAGDPFSGTYERYASATALVAAAKELDPRLDSGRAIFSRLEEGAVTHVVDRWLDEVAAGLCALIHTFNVPLVVLGGGVMEQPYAIAGVAERVERHIIPGFRGARLVGAQLGNAAGLWGAAHLARGLLEG